jgi:uncharacterized protein YceK
MDAYVIIGENESGKSSVTRSLTGCWKNGKREIATTSGNVEVYVQLSSLQESGITAADFVNTINSQGCAAVLLSLWPRGGYVYPSADSYLQYFANNGWHIERVACLDVPSSAVTGLPSGTVPTGPRIPTGAVNEVANHVRRHFRWA